MATSTQATGNALDMSVPGRCSLDGWCFSNVPTTQTSNDDVSSEFEFETTHHFEHELKQESLPAPERQLGRAPSVAFADELFCNGTLTPTSLRPPPRLRCINGKGSPLSPARSPSSSVGVLKVLFKRQSWAGDDFDPFMVALENVKEENEGKFSGHGQKWTRPMSPLWATSPQRPFDDCKLQAHQSSPAENESPIGQLAEPKGVLLARQARLVKMGYEKPKKHKIKKFLLRTISVGRTRSNEGKHKDDNIAVTMKSRSFKSITLTQHDEDERDSHEPEMTKLALIPSRQRSPNLLLCMGYGAKYDK